MSNVSLSRVTKCYGPAVAVNALSLEVEEGELLSLLGPSGCGKTTTLRMVGGFVKPDAGAISMGGRQMTDVPPERRPTAMVFQSYALWPHMTVLQNVSFGLRVRRQSSSEIRAKVENALQMVGLERMEPRYPRELSGGQQQRVALARALVVEPQVLLLDEPLSNLDAKLRVRMRADVRELQKRLGITMLYVTHDQEEALSISDRIAVMNNGRVEQLGAPQEVYEAPQTAFVASFIGHGNLLAGTVEGIVSETRLAVRLSNGTVLHASRRHPKIATGDLVSLAIQGHGVRLRHEPGDNILPGRIAVVSYLGVTKRLEVDTSAGRILADLPASVAATEGDNVHVEFPATSLLALPAA
ncbi:MAG: ABC transporter ATP-binding protein [Chloroflexota bacterium]